MTIGVGFLCPDGVALAADRQITGDGGYKFTEGKISRSGNEYWSMICTYAGKPSAAQVMIDKISSELEGQMDKSAKRGQANKALDALQKLFRDRHTKGLQMLIGLTFKTSPSLMFRTEESKVARAFTEYIGCGDSSAVRYLVSFLFGSHAMNIFQAGVLGAYIVDVANRFIDQCSGGPDIGILKQDGSTNIGTGGAFMDWKRRIGHCEQEIGNALRQLLLIAGKGTVRIEPLKKQQP